MSYMGILAIIVIVESQNGNEAARLLLGGARDLGELSRAEKHPYHFKTWVPRILLNVCVFYRSV